MAEFLIEWRPLLATMAGVSGLLFLIMVRNTNAFVALLLASLATGVAAGLAPEAVIASVTNGMGGVLGFIAVIVGLGALLGAYLEASGGASAIAKAIIGKRAPGPTSLAMGFVGIVIAIPVFFDVGLILLFPIIVSFARSARKPPLFFGLPLLAGLAAAHAFIPPTPGPVAVAQILSADIGLVILCGLAAGIPAMLVAGPLYAGWLDRRGALPQGTLTFGSDDLEHKLDLSLVFRSALAILVPIVLIVAAALTKSFGIGGIAASIILFAGHPFVALLVACGLAAWILRAPTAEGAAELRDTLVRALEPTAVILLVTGAGGAFKQVLVDTGAGEMLARNLLGMGIGPIFAGFVLAAIVRVAQGSATVAMLTAAGLAAPIAAAGGLQPLELALMVIAIASGASVVSHVNDSGFWLVSRYFGVTSAETLRTWTVTSTLVGLTGFAVVLCLALVI